MNDVIKPTTVAANGGSPPPQILDLKTPEQRAAEAQAAQEHDKKVFAQGGNSPLGVVDGMRAPRVATGSVLATTVSEAKKDTDLPNSFNRRPPEAVHHATGGGVFKLNSTIPEEQALTAGIQPPTSEQPVVEDSPGFFKRLFGGGKKAELVPPSELSQNVD